MNTSLLYLLAFSAGQWAVMSVFGLLILVLWKMPWSVREALQEDRFPWWQRVRLWAIMIAVIQILVYALWG